MRCIDLFNTLTGWHKLAWIGLVLVALSGCGSGTDGPTRYDISGLVTYDNQPVPYGTVQFLPDSSKSNQGPAGYATIVDGKFDTKKGGKGVVGGPHQVVIMGMKHAPVEGTPNPDTPVESNELFPQYVTTEDFRKEATTLNLAVGKPAR